jgi:hypothetical protein
MLARPEPGTREHILLWLASKDPNETYDWESYSKCACGTYVRECMSMSNFAWIAMPGPLVLLNNMAMRFKTYGDLYDYVHGQWGHDRQLETVRAQQVSGAPEEEAVRAQQ